MSQLLHKRCLSHWLSLPVCCRCERIRTALIHEMSPNVFGCVLPWDSEALDAMLFHNAEGDDVLYYQGWAKGANYHV